MNRHFQTTCLTLRPDSMMKAILRSNSLTLCPESTLKVAVGETCHSLRQDCSTKASFPEYLYHAPSGMFKGLGDKFVIYESHEDAGSSGRAAVCASSPTLSIS